MTPKSPNAAAPSRRTLLKTAAATTATLAAASQFVVPQGVRAAGSEVVKFGLIGCGGRGTGAAKNTLKADSNVQLVAMADMYDSQINQSLNLLQKNREIAAQVKVAPNMCFTGFDAYQKVIDASDVVLLTTTPHFRPMHLKAAIEAGKHVFAEKPVAVDAPGIRSVLETAKKAKEKNLSLLVGFCYRYEFSKRETVKRIHDGAIGDVQVIHCNYITGDPGRYHVMKEGPETMEYQMKNWYYFTWLSGDHIVEQHCHNHDKAAWVLKGEYPVSAYGLGGRQSRTDPKLGNIFDHHTVVYDYKSGARVISMCRQFTAPGIVTDVSDHVFGTKGKAELQTHTIAAAGAKPWVFEDPNSDMYDQEHIEFYQAIRAGTPLNNGVEGARSSLMSIMGRMATYTGRRITWDMAMNSKEDLSPPKYDWGPLKYAPVAVPGVTKFV
jgi:myo-inositol 2-dehydrogenase / D-chiro-inositol 1-dehydrogenase